MFTNATETVCGGPRVRPYTPFRSSPASNLGLAFCEACRGDTPNAVNNLREATTDLVVSLKTEGASPERVILTMKDALTRYGISHFPPSLVSPPNEYGKREAAQYRRVFSWCLEALYGPT
jgi:hypothetical protein